MPKRKRETVASEANSKAPEVKSRSQTTRGGARAQQRGNGRVSASQTTNVVQQTKTDVNETLPKQKRRQSPGKAVEPDLRKEARQVDHAGESKKVSEPNQSMPLAARTAGHQLFIGAHVSSAGGVPNSILNSVHIGANAFALFLKSQRKWSNPPLSSEHSTGFIGNCRNHSYDQDKHVVPHGSYLVNLAHTDTGRTEQAYAAFLDDLKRCESLGITLYNFHPGNTVGNDRSTAIAHLASNLNRAHKATKGVVTLLENMAAGGNVLGSTFEDLRDIISLIEVKSRVGVCIDTCHAFAAGYDMRTRESFAATMEQFDHIVGIQYLRAIHMNDSKAPFASHRDLHANIGTGFIGLRGFHAIINDSRLERIPIILETPIEVRNENGELVKDAKGKAKEDKGIWAREIKLLESLLVIDPESVEFRELESRLARQGGPERMRLLEQQERKLEKSREKANARIKRRPSGNAAKEGGSDAFLEERSSTDNESHDP